MSTDRDRATAQPVRAHATWQWIAAGVALCALFAAAIAVKGCSKNKDRARDMGALNESNVARLMARHRGKVVLMSFWAVWCQPCDREMPVLVAAAKAHRKAGLALITVDMTDASAGGPNRAFLERHHVPAPRFQYKGKRLKDFTRALGVTWQGDLPATFLFDRKGKLRWSHLGPVTRPQLEAQLKPLL